MSLSTAGGMKKEKKCESLHFKYGHIYGFLFPDGARSLFFHTFEVHHVIKIVLRAGGFTLAGRARWA